MGLTASRTIIPIKEAHAKLGHALQVKIEKVRQSPVDLREYDVFFFPPRAGGECIWPSRRRKRSTIHSDIRLEHGGSKRRMKYEIRSFSSPPWKNMAWGARPAHVASGPSPIYLSCSFSLACPMAEECVQSRKPSGTLSRFSGRDSWECACWGYST